MVAPALHRTHLMHYSDEPPHPPDSVTLREHLEMRIHYESMLQQANDRRYAEVNIEREKALKIKEEADKAALGLAREIQTYKDEKANELREQISSERGLYTTKPELIASIEKVEALIAPLTAYVNSQRGRGAGLGAGWSYVVSGVGLLSTIILLFFLLAGK
jgi:vacuolar-type H+-ATPase subunit H